MLSNQANVDHNSNPDEEGLHRTESGRTSFQFLMELIPICVETTFQVDLPLVLTCESRGAVTATSPASNVNGANRLLLQDTILFHILVLRNKEFDDEFNSNSSSQPAINGSPLQAFEPFMARVTIRDNCATGTVRDFAAVNLANFITGPHGVVDYTLELQLGSRISLQVKSDLVDASKTTGPTRTIPDAVIANKGMQKHALLDAPSFAVTSTYGTQIECKPVYKDVSALHESDSKNDVRSFCDVPNIQDAGESAGQATNSINKKLTTENEVRDKSQGWRDSRKEQRRREAIDLLLCQGSPENASSQHESVCSPCNSSDEDDIKHFSALAEIEREWDPGHPFKRLVTKRCLGELYSTYTENGVHEERCLLSYINSPFPVSIWSIQGPSIPENEPEEELVNMGDSILVSKRNIRKLKAAAERSSTKPSPPAAPGNVSPLQLTYILPIQKRDPLVVGLGKPWRPSQRTVLNASRWMRDFGINIDEPVIDDSDESEEEDNKVDRVDRESEDVEPRNKAASNGTPENSGNAPNSQSASEAETILRGSLQSTSQNRASTRSMTATATNVVNIDANSKTTLVSGEEGEVSKTDGANVRDSASRFAEMINRLNDAEAENLELKQLLKTAESTIVQLRSKLLEASLQRQRVAENFEVHHAEELPGIDAPEREWLNHLQMQNHILIEREAKLSALLRQVSDEKEISKSELLKLQQEVLTGISVRQENERLLKVILDLKTELDHEPGSPDIVNQLKEAKSQIVLQREEMEMLKNEIAKLKNKDRESSPKHSGGFFSGFPR